jgi:glycosidase
MKKFVLILVLLGWNISTLLAANAVSCYPSHWWIGMKQQTLQLMIQSKSDLSAAVKVTGSGLIIKKVFQPENKHYLFIDLLITAAAKPGQYKFTLGDGTAFNYELKLRKTNNPNVHQGVRSNDLIYLIMPDRFANGNPANDSFADLQDNVADRQNPYARHGGDLQGVTQKLDYLKGIGVTALWLTPVLENNMPRMTEGPYVMSGYHGYWTTDHYQVDKRLGGNGAYKEMVDAAHKKGLKVIQDAVYNHVGSYHHTVLDLPMRDWLNQWPSYTPSNHREELFTDPYAAPSEKKVMIGGWFMPHLPDLNLANPYCANFVIQNNIWATEEFGIDGWRVDTYKYCDEKFLNNINAALIREFPNLTVFGEAWTNSVPASAYFTENNMDVPFKHQIKGVTDFPLNGAIYDALNQPFGWTEGVNRLYMTLSQDFLYKNPMTNCIFLDNHDMNRFYSMVKEDIAKYKMGLGLLLTMRGIPQIYYGTEVLMKNYKDPNDAAVRKDFPGGWAADATNKFESGGRNAMEQQAFEYFKQLANYRKTSPALTNGKLVQYIPQNGVYVYFRVHANQTIMCILNTSAQQTALPTARFDEIIGSNKFGINIITGESTDLKSSLNLPPNAIIMMDLKK